MRAACSAARCCPAQWGSSGRCLLCKGTACGGAATMQLHRRNVPSAAAPRRQGRRGLQPCGGQDIAPSAGALPLVPGGGGAPCCAKYQFSEPGGLRAPG